jgi:serine/threonine-protein kinase
MLSTEGDIRLVGLRPGRGLAQLSPSGVEHDLRSAAQLVRDLMARSSASDPSHDLATFCDPAADASALRAAAVHLRNEATPDRTRFAAFMGDLIGRHLTEEAERDSALVKQTETVLAVPLARRTSDDYPKEGARLGAYRIVRAIGEGGMGRVLEGVHEARGTRAAIKVLHPNRRTPAIEERFRREAAAVARIDSPHVVRVESFGETDDKKLLYLAMEYVDGRTLDQVIRSEGPLETARALQIGKQIAEGVAAAHAAGVIHRDLKPGNIMVMGSPPEESIKVLDFGLARVDTPQELALTQAGDLVGTFVYAAPEQALGRPATPAFDVYAIGELLYEMLSGNLPHVANETHELLKKKATVEPTPLSEHRPDVAPSVSAVVMRALARMPEDRQASAAELAYELGALLERREVPTQVPRRSPVLAYLGVGAAVGAISLVLALLHRAGSAPQEPVVQSSSPATPEPTPLAAVKPHAPAAQNVPVAPASRAVDESAHQAPAPPPPTHPPPSPTAARRTPSTRRSPPTAPEPPSTLRDAERAFEAGNTIEAIQLATDALGKGGGVSAHLALGKYYMRMRLNGEALKHYKAVLAADPENDVASTAVGKLERGGAR